MKTKNKPFIALLLTSVLVLGAGSAKSATLLFDSSEPTGDVFLSNISAGAGSNGTVISKTATVNQWAGFSFQPTTSLQMDKITVYIRSASDALGDTQLTIQVVKLASLTSAPTLSVPSTILSTETGSLPSTGLANNSFAYLTIDLATPVTLEANEYYGILLYYPFTSPNISGFSLRRVAGTSSDQRGYYTADQGSTWTTNLNPSFMFALTAVPEPGTLGMLLLGGLGLWMRRRQQGTRLAN